MTADGAFAATGAPGVPPPTPSLPVGSLNFSGSDPVPLSPDDFEYFYSPIGGVEGDSSSYAYTSSGDYLTADVTGEVDVSDGLGASGSVDGSAAAEVTGGATAATATVSGDGDAPIDGTADAQVA